MGWPHGDTRGHRELFAGGFSLLWPVGWGHLSWLGKKSNCKEDQRGVEPHSGIAVLETELRYWCSDAVLVSCSTALRILSLPRKAHIQGRWNGTRSSTSVRPRVWFRAARWKAQDQPWILHRWTSIHTLGCSGVHFNAYNHGSNPHKFGCNPPTRVQTSLCSSILNWKVFDTLLSRT